MCVASHQSRGTIARDSARSQRIGLANSLQLNPSSYHHCNTHLIVKMCVVGFPIPSSGETLLQRISPRFAQNDSLLESSHSHLCAR